jgi:hypothetical protein
MFILAFIASQVLPQAIRNTRTTLATTSLA